jgi:hypothetical protein
LSSFDSAYGSFQYTPEIAFDVTHPIFPHQTPFCYGVDLRLFLMVYHCNS